MTEQVNFSTCGHNLETPQKTTYSITVAAGAAWLLFSPLNFFATAVFIKGELADEDVHDITLDSTLFTYPSYTKRMIGSLALPNTSRPPSTTCNGLLTKNAGNFTIFNCTWHAVR